MKRLALVLLLAVVACGSPSPADGPAVHKTIRHAVVWVEDVELPEGGSVQCVIFEGYRAGGLSCDWDDSGL